jgi:hypothetical protein
MANAIRDCCKTKKEAMHTIFVSRTKENTDDVFHYCVLTAKHSYNRTP